MMSPSSVQLAVRNATQEALLAFFDAAPRFGSMGGHNGAAGWLQPYVRQLLIEMRALGREARLVVTHARQVGQLRREHRAGKMTGGAAADRDDEGVAATATQFLLAEQKRARERRRRELLLSALLCAAAIGVGPPTIWLAGLGGEATQSLLSKISPALAAVPTILAGMGVWRLAQRPLLLVAQAGGQGARLLAEMASEGVRASARAMQRLMAVMPIAQRVQVDAK